MSYETLWIVWLLNFLAIELPALIDKKPGATLSYHIWKWFSIKEKAKWWIARRTALGLFLAWLLVHMMGWWL